MKRLTLAFFAVSVLVGLSVSTALAQWPTNCVELNDLIEASLGNHENVGIYERVHGDQAEAVCQSEHRDSGFQFGVRPYQLPSKSDPTAYTQAFVERAIHRYNTEGLQATLDYYNSPQSIDGQWYVFIIDENQTIIAHAPNPDLVGKHVSQALGPNSYPTGSAVAASADEDGAWFDYTYANPASGVVETKHSWVVIHDGITFGSGWYERGPGKSDASAYTKAFVQQATNLYVALGLEETVAYYNAKESVDGQWYVFIIDPDGYTIAHHNPQFRGRDPSLRVDVTGYFYGDDLLAADENGRWVDYVFLNPETGEQPTKHTWAIRHDGLIFASGWYE